MAKEAEELNAMSVMGKLPAYQHKGPKRDGSAMTSGADVNSGTGKRLTAMFRNR